MFAFGGFNGSDLNTMEAYSPATNTWATLPSMPTARHALAGAAAPCPRGVDGLEGTCVFAIGGRNGSGFLSTVEAYSPATNTWATLPSMPTARESLAGATAPCPKGVDGREGTCVFAIGGDNPGFLNTVEAYSPSANTWATLPSMPTARTALAAAAAPCPKGVDGLRGTCVFAIGGFGGTFLNTVEAYSPSANTWATLPPLPTARDGLAAATAPCPDVLRGTCVYAVGGHNDGVFLSTVETYSSSANTWATLPPLPTARELLAAGSAPCPDGVDRPCVYAVGGDNPSVLNTAEAFDIDIDIDDGHR
ncbi:hypothetical protein AAW14_00550 [Streptomyces hygroscopicus]|nr:hypothetical protein [Streptomyces hygroscopicus]